MLIVCRPSAARALPQLLLTLGGNAIVSVAVEAFQNLKALGVNPSAFNPVNPDGTPFHDFFGTGLWRHTEPGFFGGGPFMTRAARMKRLGLCIFLRFRRLICSYRGPA